MTKIQERLFELQDMKYRDFHSNLMPTVGKESIIGVRVPAIRKFAKELNKCENVQEFLKELPHKYYEENNLHAAIILGYKNYDDTIEAVEAFLPHINNWATCDMLSPKIFKKYPSELLERIKTWIASDHIYTIRFGIKMLMDFYLEEHFESEYLEMVANVKSEEYYVNMMIAWYFATALAKQYDAALPYLEEKRLADWTHNKTIQKAVESYRITEEHKQYLRQLRMKK